MKSWEDEQREYQLSKEASVEMAAMCFSGIVILVVVSLIAEVWTRFIAPLFS